MRGFLLNIMDTLFMDSVGDIGVLQNEVLYTSHLVQVLFDIPSAQVLGVCNILG